ncbi:MAG: RNA polymerase sigma factor [Bacteroidales bacterium]
MDQDKELLVKCLERDAEAEKQLYDRFAPKMYGVCLRFAGNRMEAEDILQNGFIYLFGNLKKFRFEGSLEGWVRRIFVNAAINYYRSNLKFKVQVELPGEMENTLLNEDALSAMSTKELLKVIQGLHPRYRTIFNLYVIENYGHKEISEMLGISVGTSKAQLCRAKQIIRKILLDQ